MADSVSLAVLENLVHMNREDFPVGYVVIGAVLPKNVEILSSDRFRATEGNLEAQALGDRWIESGLSAVLKVQSAVVPSELNPKHPDFSRIVTEIAVPFTFDERLFRKSRSCLMRISGRANWRTPNCHIFHSLALPSREHRPFRVNRGSN